MAVANQLTPTPIRAILKNTKNGKRDGTMPGAMIVMNRSKSWLSKSYRQFLPNESVSVMDAAREPNMIAPFPSDGIELKRGMRQNPFRIRFMEIVADGHYRQTKTPSTRPNIAMNVLNGSLLQ
jgi:hypothetical protein